MPQLVTQTPEREVWSLPGAAKRERDLDITASSANMAAGAEQELGN